MPTCAGGKSFRQEGLQLLPQPVESEGLLDESDPRIVREGGHHLVLAVPGHHEDGGGVAPFAKGDRWFRRLYQKEKGLLRVILEL